MVKTNLNKGFVTQIIGPVLDIQFSEGNLPLIYSAIKIALEDGTETIVEVQQLLGDNKVRAVSMRSTDGLKRGVEAIDLGTPIGVPKSNASTPRFKPSVERIDTARTWLSPNNCCTSTIVEVPSSNSILIAL